MWYCTKTFYMYESIDLTWSGSERVYVLCELIGNGPLSAGSRAKREGWPR